MVLRTCRKLLAARRKFLALRPQATSFSSITLTTSSASRDPPCDRRKVTKTVFALVTYNYASLPFYRRLFRRRRSCKMPRDIRVSIAPLKTLPFDRHSTLFMRLMPLSALVITRSCRSKGCPHYVYLRRYYN